MSFDQLEAFVAVVEEGAVVRGAKRLHISQPPLTRRLAALEDELGTRLLERHARGVRLTPSGAVFLVHARSILRAVEDAAAAVAPQTSGAPHDGDHSR